MLIVKLGGSVIQENLLEINPKIYECIEKMISFNQRIAVAIGGGKVCRLYQNPLIDINKADTKSIHRVGTRAINLQADFIRNLFPPDEVVPFLIDSDEALDIAIKVSPKYKYFARGAWIPGRSSDYEATDLALKFSSKSVLRISNVDYVYSSDPRKNTDAQKLKKLTWDEYLNVIGNPKSHLPGTSYPVDPIAAKYAKENNIRFYFTSLENFLKIKELDLNNFDGTVIG